MQTIPHHHLLFYILSSQRTSPKIAEKTSPTTTAISRNFLFFTVTLGSGLDGLGLAGIMS